MILATFNLYASGSSMGALVVPRNEVAFIFYEEQVILFSQIKTDDERTVLKETSQAENPASQVTLFPALFMLARFPARTKTHICAPHGSSELGWHSLAVPLFPCSIFHKSPTTFLYMKQTKRFNYTSPIPLIICTGDKCSTYILLTNIQNACSVQMCYFVNKIKKHSFMI